MITDFVYLPSYFRHHCGINQPALAKVVRRTLQPAAAVYCAVCRRIHHWDDLRFDGHQADYGLDFATCKGGNTLCRVRVLGCDSRAA